MFVDIHIFKDGWLGNKQRQNSTIAHLIAVCSPKCSTEVIFCYKMAVGGTMYH